MMTTEGGVLAAELASRSSRFLASAFDGLLALGLSFPVLVHLGGLTWLRAGQPLPFPVALQVTAANVAVFLLLNAYSLHAQGQTLGKRLLGIRIVDAKTGRIPSLSRLILRRYGFVWMLNTVPGVRGVAFPLDFIFIVRADRRALHDLVGGTLVVRA